MILANIAIWKKGFSKQNLIKNYLHPSSKLVILDAVMHISYINIAIENINWNVVLILCRTHERL